MEQLVLVDVKLLGEEGCVARANREAHHGAHVAENCLLNTADGVGLGVERARLREGLAREDKGNMLLSRLGQQTLEVGAGKARELVHVDHEGVEAAGHGVVRTLLEHAVIEARPAADRLRHATVEDGVAQLHGEELGERLCRGRADDALGHVGDKDLALVHDALDAHRGLASAEDVREHAVARDAAHLGEEPLHDLAIVAALARAGLHLGPLVVHVLVCAGAQGSLHVLGVGEEEVELGKLAREGIVRFQDEAKAVAQHLLEARACPVVAAIGRDQLQDVAHGLRDGGGVGQVDVEQVQARQVLGVREVEEDHVGKAMLGNAGERVEGVLGVGCDDGDAGAAADVLALHLVEEVGLARAGAADDEGVAVAVVAELEDHAAAVRHLAQGDAQAEVADGSLEGLGLRLGAADVALAVAHARSFACLA